MILLARFFCDPAIPLFIRPQVVEAIAEMKAAAGAVEGSSTSSPKAGGQRWEGEAALGGICLHFFWEGVGEGRSIPFIRLVAFSKKSRNLRSILWKP